MTPPDLTSQDLALSWSFDFENRDDDTYQRAYSYISIDSSSSSSSNTGLNMLINSSYVVPMMEPTLALVVKNKTIPESAHTIYVKKGQTVQVKLFNADPGGENVYIV